MVQLSSSCSHTASARRGVRAMTGRQISLTGTVERCPVVTAGGRWPCVREDQGPEPYFSIFPECRGDPHRNDYGSVRQWPPPFSRGGGFFPVLLLLHDGRLCCALRTGAPHAGSGSEISITCSADRGASWSPYRVVVRSDPERCIDRRNPALGQTAAGDLVMATGRGAPGMGHLRHRLSLPPGTVRA